MAIIKKQKQKKEKKIYFSPEIDSSIEGFSLVLTFAVVGLILQFYPSYFGNEIVTNIVKWLFIVVGILGLASELGKRKNQIVGLDNIVYGTVFTGAWVVLFVYVRHWIANTLSFAFLIFGLYSFFMGIQQVIHSISLYRKEKASGAADKEKTRGDILLFLTKLLGVILVAFQICKAVMDIPWPQG